MMTQSSITPPAPDASPDPASYWQGYRAALIHAAIAAAVVLGAAHL